MLGKKSFLCRFGHFIQFLEKLLIASLNLAPTFHGGNGCQTRLLCRSTHFIQFLANIILALDSPTPEGGGLEKMTSKHIWTFHSIPSKKTFFFLKLEVGTDNISVQILTFHSIPSKYIFCNLIPTPSSLMR